MFAFEIDVERLREVCERYGVVRLEVFGSLSRGTGGSDSDIDLLYTLSPEARLGWAIEDLSDELAAVLGRPVDLVSRRALNRRIREQVLAEAQPFYDAVCDVLPTGRGLVSTAQLRRSVTAAAPRMTSPAV